MLSLSIHERTRELGLLRAVGQTRRERAAQLERSPELIETARNAPGCIDLHLSADPLEPDRNNNYEQWASLSDLDAFRRSSPPRPDRRDPQSRGVPTRDRLITPALS